MLRFDDFGDAAGTHDLAEFNGRDIAVPVIGHPALHGRVERHMCLLQQYLSFLKFGRFQNEGLEQIRRDSERRSFDQLDGFVLHDVVDLRMIIGGRR
jgi:hypothetical protein